MKTTLLSTSIARVLALRGKDGKWRTNIGLNNATDETYPVAGNSSLSTGSGYAEIAYARPQEWFANFQYDF